MEPFVVGQLKLLEQGVDCQLTLRFDQSDGCEPLRLLIELQWPAFRYESLKRRVLLLLVGYQQVIFFDEVFDLDCWLFSANVLLGHKPNISELEAERECHLLLVIHCLDEVVKDFFDVQLNEDFMHLITVIAETLECAFRVVIHHVFRVFRVFAQPFFVQLKDFREQYHVLLGDLGSLKKFSPLKDVVDKHLVVDCQLFGLLEVVL